LFIFTFEFFFGGGLLISNIHLHGSGTLYYTIWSQLYETYHTFGKKVAYVLCNRFTCVIISEFTFLLEISGGRNGTQTNLHWSG